MNFVLDQIVSIEKEAQQIAQQAQSAQQHFEERLAKECAQMEREFEQTFRQERDELLARTGKEEAEQLRALEQEYAQKLHALEGEKNRNSTVWEQELFRRIVEG